MLSFTNSVMKITSAKMKSGPTKLCRFFASVVRDAKAAWPTIGRMTYLPKRITMPVRASTTKDRPIVQCATRSTLEKRSICRPVRGSCTLIGPLAR